LSLDLLIEQGRDLARHPAKGEIAVSLHTSDHVTRLIQRADQKPFRGPSTQAETNVADAVSLCLRDQSKQTVPESLFVAGDACPGRQSECDSGDIGVRGLGSSIWGGQSQEADQEERRTHCHKGRGREIEDSSQKLRCRSERNGRSARNGSR
jgi:hypothetical protein